MNAEREYPNPFFIKNGKDPFINCKPYINCLDYIHTGYVALSQATQLFYNDICNSKMYFKTSFEMKNKLKDFWK